MPRVLDPRQHVRVHSGMPEHPKVEPLSDAAFRCLVEAWCLCRRTGNDGRIPARVWNNRWKAKARREVIAAGLAVADGGEIEIHDWLDHQPTAAELDAKRAVRAEAGRKGGKASGATRRGGKQNGSDSEANTEANASTEGGHETVTFVENYAVSETRNSRTNQSTNQTVSDGVKTPSPAETIPDAQANASRLLEQMPKPSGSKVQPDKDKDKEIGGYVGGNRYESNAENSRNEPPPKHHPEHPDAYEPGCSECERTYRRYERHLTLALAETEPSPFCERHRDGTYGGPCAACGRERKRNEQWWIDRRHAEALAASEAARAAAELRARAIADCPLGCGEHDGYTPNGAVCDHDPGHVDRARRGVAAARIALCRRCDDEGHRADGTECDHGRPAEPEPEEHPAHA